MSQIEYLTVLLAVCLFFTHIACLPTTVSFSQAYSNILKINKPANVSKIYVQFNSDQLKNIGSSETNSGAIVGAVGAILGAILGSAGTYFLSRHLENRKDAREKEKEAASNTSLRRLAIWELKAYEYFINELDKDPTISKSGEYQQSSNHLLVDKIRSALETYPKEYTKLTTDSKAKALQGESLILTEVAYNGFFNFSKSLSKEIQDKVLFKITEKERLKKDITTALGVLEE